MEGCDTADGGLDVLAIVPGRPLVLVANPVLLMDDKREQHRACGWDCIVHQRHR